MPVISTRYLFQASSLLLLGFLSLAPGLAAGPVASATVVDQVLSPADQVLAKDVNVMENRFFFHQYGHDPLEKRLERLELLTLGAAQGGTNSERLARLKQAIIDRDKAAAKTIAREQKGDGELAAKTNYPVLGTLEWRMLKKTYPNESIDQRLARMESQLFGVPAQAMSYIDRIDRLKKTIGLDIATAPLVTAKPGAKNQIGMGGPMPRANRGGMQIQIGPGFQSNGQNNGNGSKSGYIYDKDGNVTGWYQNNTQSWSWPGNSSAQPGQTGGQNVFEAMDQMNRQMNEMMRHLNAPGLGSGFGSGFAPGFGGLGGFGGLDEGDESPFPNGGTLPEAIHGGRQLHQGPLNQGKIAPKNQQTAPQVKKFTVPKEELPAYTDPNSI